MDRKSTFQAHLAPVFSGEEVQQVLAALMQNTKVTPSRSFGDLLPHHKVGDLLPHHKLETCSQRKRCRRCSLLS